MVDGPSLLPAVPGLARLEGWIDDEAERSLLASVDASPWQDDLARRVQHHGYRYDYKARRADASMRIGDLPPWAAALAERIVREGLCERTPDQVIVNEYQPGQGIAMHVDCVPCFGPVVLSLTLGSGCVLDLARRGTEPAAELWLPPRSLLVLAGEARLAWAHGIKKRKSDLVGGVRVPRGRRVSLTFRTVRLGGH